MPILDVVLSQIREIGYYVLDSDEPFGESSELLLKRMLLLFSKETIREATSVASELANLIERIRRSKGEAESNTDVIQLIELFAKEAIPSDILQALAIPSSLILGSEICPAVQIILSRGAFVSMPNELSTSRLRLRQAREQVAKLQSTTHIAIGKDSEGLENRFIWRNMGNGMLSIEK